MPYAVGVSQDPDAGRAIGEVVGHILNSLGPGPDVAALFVCGEHNDGTAATNSPDLADMAEVVTETLGPTTMFGCSSSGLVGGSLEVEQGPGIALWAGRMDGNVTAHHLSSDPFQDGDSLQDLVEPVTQMPTSQTTDPDKPNPNHQSTSRSLPPEKLEIGSAHTLVLLGDPYSFDVEKATKHWTEQAPHLQVIGGLSASPQANLQLLANAAVKRDGCVALLVSGDTEVAPLVSQGCRPIGQPLIVTASTNNRIESLGGKPPATRLNEMVAKMSPEETELLRGGLLIGRVVDEHKAEFERGDFLIRNIMGLERDSGAIVIADFAPVGSTIQFHVRDASTAHEDLQALLTKTGNAQGALLFTCNGRGSHMFSEPNHDASAVAAATDDGAVAGMFCAGEIGPIGGLTAIHGFTASAAVFRDRSQM